MEILFIVFTVLAIVLYLTFIFLFIRGSKVVHPVIVGILSGVMYISAVCVIPFIANNNYCIVCSKPCQTDTVLCNECLDDLVELIKDSK